MNPLRILYDGWSLCREPNSPAALHLLAILAYLPDHIQPLIAFPETPPTWIPDRGHSHVEVTPLNSRLQWEQRILPYLREKLKAHLLHLMTETASLLDGVSTVISPTQPETFDQPHPRGEASVGLVSRLRAALAAGGTARAQTFFWPEDLPPLPGKAILSLPPLVHPDFTAGMQADPIHIPSFEAETFVLYHGPQDMASLQRALKAWTWAAGPVGELYPLVFLGLGDDARAEVDTMAGELKVRDTVVLLPAIPPESVAPLYRRAELLFHPAGVSAWGGAIRHALACGKPVVAAETAWASALVGPAAILVEPEDTRRLGASVIGIIVKEHLAARLNEAAIVRSQGWVDMSWGEKLAAAYERVLLNF
jgi:hypothetical protein